ncbi:RNA polymerase sigma factor [Mangrovibacterium marinum]|uniref:RNA polymerase sigma factor n=1 Tax=Mangrovibacterium marinum TaxID=1639118 RepID=A0A2T5C3U6_9BACT|nr:RNA polymerase sigma-70 factor [Mangrovibacterium marinum]PTN09480.1 RNA polymerase sigma-70 factor (ECF subfamily) [Mangrovibacterium marinum]
MIKSKSEEELIRELKQGDRKAFQLLFELYAKRIFAFAKGYLKSASDAEEIVQDVFVKVWHARESINTELSFKAYLFKITYNGIREYFNKQSRENRYKHEILDYAIEFDNRTEERIDYKSLLDLVEEKIEQLPPRQREIILLSKKQGVPTKEIAALLEISPRTVEKHLSEALKQLKKELSDDQVAGLLFYHLFLDPKKK